MSLYAEQTVRNSSRLRRFSHKARYAVATSHIVQHRPATVLDYGAGDGTVVAEAANALTTSNFVAFEPVMHAQTSATLAGLANAQLAKSLDEVAGPFELIICTEVLEHLPDPVLKNALSSMKRLIAHGGQILISVPIESGPVAVVKNLVRGRGTMTYGAYLKRLNSAFFGKEVHRPATKNYILDHYGFNHKKLLKEILETGFILETTRYAPFGVGGSAMNTQVYWTFRVAKDSNSDH